MAGSVPVSDRAFVFFRSYVGFRYVFLAIVFFFVIQQLSQFPLPDTILPSQSSSQSLNSTHANSDEVLTPDLLKSTPSYIDESSASAAQDFEESSGETITHLYSRIGKVTSVWYDKPTLTSQAYERALLSHKLHDEAFGYKHYVQRRGAIEKLWSKHAYLFHLMVQELNKPVAERLEWLFWHDADVILLNSKMPLEAFLPPDGNRWAHINLLISNDLGGLNDGIFFIRICEWSVYLLAAALSFPFYRPQVHLRYDEQSALAFVLEDKKYANNTVHVPQEWFNAYHAWGHDKAVPPEWHFDYPERAPGDLLVHLPGAGDNRVGIIDEYLRKVGWMGTEKDIWNVPFNETVYAQTIPKWWSEDAEREQTTQEEYWRRYHILAKVGGEMDRVKDEDLRKLREELKGNGSSALDIAEAEKNYEEGWVERKMSALRQEEQLRKSGAHEDNVKVD